MADINVLKGLGSIRRYKKGSIIFNEGDNGNEMYIVLSGKVGIYIRCHDNSPAEIASIDAGGFFGEMCVLESEPRSATAIAVNDSVLLSINSNSFEFFIEKQPSLAYKIMKGLSFRIRNLNEEVKRLKEELKTYTGDKAQSSDCGLTTANSESMLNNEGTIKGCVNLCKPILPPEHKSYGITAPEEYNIYLFDKHVKCPVCDKEFTVDAFRLSKLKLEKQDFDFRRKYVDFEPLWYSIWVCPNCFYSNSYSDFEKMSGMTVKLVKEKVRDIKDRVSFRFSTPRNIDEVFASYYLALYFAEASIADPLKPAKLWLQLSWLYQDVNEEELSKKASLTSLDYYHNAYYNGSLDFSVQEEQQLCLIIGELLLKKGAAKEAAQHFYKAIKNKSDSPGLNKQAQDRIQDLRQNYLKNN
ncbi:MAG: DUF2225 domain-containing protein [Acetivibrionales bacterium]